jgi:2-oxoisovalerate dehydrogenase E2 component (dihydrolipoyl transacylase)
MAATAASVSVTMPKLGESVVEGTVVRWLKKEGEAVKKYEPLAEVVTDKVNSEIPAPAEGTVMRLSVAEGQTVPVGLEIAQIAVGNGMPSVGASETEAPASAAPVQPEEAGGAATDGDVQPRSSPLVRRLAKEHNVNLDEVTGTGTGGRVRKEDILAFIEQRGAPAATPSQPVAPTPLPVVISQPSAPAAVGDDEEPLPLTPVRRAIAEHMVRSLATSPHTWTYVECDVSPLVAWRRAERESFRKREGIDLTYVPFMCKALVETLREHPMLNSTWRDNQVVLKKRINLGVAVALEDNLVVPVIKDADRLNVAGLAHALSDLVQRARDGQLKPDDVQGGTITLNNTGALGSLLSKPIINQPQAAILTMEAIQKRVVVVESSEGDAIAIRSMMNVCISFDHRICDGLQVGRFMQALKKRIEAYGPGGSLY